MTEVKNTANSKSKFWILLTTSMVSSLIMLDSNIVAVSLPAIGQSLNASFTEIEWVISAYLLNYAALLLAAGSFADLYGRKKAMLIGLFIFAIASGVCGVATSSIMLNLARAVQGIGGALLLTAALAIITNTFTGEERVHAFAVWGACLGVALTAGPILGGVITKFFGWRWVFLVNIPVCVILIFATFKVIKETKDPEAKSLHYFGVLTFSPGLFLLVWALIDGNEAGWVTTTILLRFAGAIIFLVLFCFAELKQKRPMVDFGLFRNSSFVGSVYAMIGYGATAQVMVFYLPLFLQNAYGFEPAKAGLSMLPFALPMVLAPRLTSNLAKRFSGKILLTSGLMVTLVGNLVFWFIAKNNLPYPIFLIGMLIAGTGAGILNGETVKAIQGAVPPERAGMASGIASTTRFIGILVGVAGLGVILSQIARNTFVHAATKAGETQVNALSAAKYVTSGNIMELENHVPKNLQRMLHEAGLASYAKGFSAACILAAALAALACILTFLYVRSKDTMPSPSSEKKPVHCKTVDCRNPI